MRIPPWFAPAAGRTLAALAVLAALVALPLAVAAAELHPTPEEVAGMASASEVRLSPDGRTIAYLLSTNTLDPEAKPSKDDADAGWKRERQIWIVDAAGGTPPRQLTRGSERAGAPRWSPDGRTLAFVRKLEGRPTIHVLDLAGGEATPVRTGELEPGAFDWSPDGKWFAFTAEVPLTAAEKDAKWKSGGVEAWDAEWRSDVLWVVASHGGEPRRVGRDDRNIVEWDWSPDGTRFAVLSSDSADPYESDNRLTAQILAVQNGALVRSLDAEPRTMERLRWSPDGRYVAFLTTRESLSLLNVLAVCDVQAGGVRNAAPDLERTLASFEWAPDAQSLVACVLDGTKTRLLRFSISGTEPEDTGFTGRTIEGGLSRSHDGATWAFLSSTGREPADPTVFEPSAPNLRSAVRLNPQVDSWALGSQEIVRWTTPDGVELEGLLTVPATKSSRRGAAPNLLVLPHGGPDSVSLDGWNTMAQFFAAHGYAVFRPNYRGGIGYGQALYTANRGRLGEIEFTDIESGVDALIAAGKADPKRMVYGGWSWGGYLTAWTIGHTDRYRAAVIGAGVADVALSYVLSDINHGVAAQWEYRGDPWRQREHFDRADPVRAIGSAVTPTLLLHGRGDKRVPFEQSVILYRALRDLGCPVAFHAYPREPHGFTEPAHLAHRLRVWTAWYDDHIGKSPTPARTPRGRTASRAPAKN